MLVSFLFSILLTYLFLINPFVLFFILILEFWVNNLFFFTHYIILALIVFYFFWTSEFLKAIVLLIFSLLAYSENLFYLKFDLNYYLIQILGVFYLFVLIKTKNYKKIKVLKGFVLLFMIFVSFFNLFYAGFEEKRKKEAFKLNKDFVFIVKEKCAVYSYVFNISNKTLNCKSFKNLSNSSKNYYFFVIENDRCFVY